MSLTFINVSLKMTLFTLELIFILARIQSAINGLILLLLVKNPSKYDLFCSNNNKRKKNAVNYIKIFKKRFPTESISCHIYTSYYFLFVFYCEFCLV